LSTKNFDKVHNKVLKAGLPGLTGPRYEYNPNSSGTILLGDILTYGFSDRSGSMRATTRLLTPIPIQSLSGYPFSERKSIIENAPRRVEEVQFVP